MPITRAAHSRTAREICRSCEERGLRLSLDSPVVVAAFAGRDASLSEMLDISEQMTR